YILLAGFERIGSYDANSVFPLRCMLALKAGIKKHQSHRDKDTTTIFRNNGDLVERHLSDFATVTFNFYPLPGDDLSLPDNQASCRNINKQWKNGESQHRRD